MGFLLILLLFFGVIYFFYLIRTQQNREIHRLIVKRLLAKDEDLVGFKQWERRAISIAELSDQQRKAMKIGERVDEDTTVEQRIYHVIVMKNKEAQRLYSLIILFDKHEIKYYNWSETEDAVLES